MSTIPAQLVTTGLSRRVTTPELQRMNRRDAIRAALHAVDIATDTAVCEWLAEHDVSVPAIEVRRASRSNATRKDPDGMRLHEDGVVDEVAIELVVTGQRMVPLTDTERRIVAERIVAAGGGPQTIADRLGAGRGAAWALYLDVTDDAPEQEVAA